MPAKETVKKGEATRLAIEDAAIQLFLEQGYHATSMRQIAEHAELALGGIYNHFSSKDEIFEAIILDQHPYKKILPLILAVEGETAEEFFGNAFRIVIRELGKEPEFLISNSVLSKLLPKNTDDAYIDIFLHGILKESS